MRVAENNKSPSLSTITIVYNTIYIFVLFEKVSDQHDGHCRSFQWYNISIVLQIDQCKYFLTVLTIHMLYD